MAEEAEQKRMIEEERRRKYEESEMKQKQREKEIEEKMRLAEESQHKRYLFSFSSVMFDLMTAILQQSLGRSYRATRGCCCSGTCPMASWWTV